MKHNRELTAYQKMLQAILELKPSKSPGVVEIPLNTFLKAFNKCWNKHFAKQFRIRGKG